MSKSSKFASRILLGSALGVLSCGSVLAGVVSASNVTIDPATMAQNVAYSKDQTTIAFDPTDPMVEHAIAKAHQGAIRDVVLVTREDGNVKDVAMNNDNGVWMVTLPGNHAGMSYKFAIRFQDGKTVTIDNPYATNSKDSTYSDVNAKNAHGSQNVNVVTPDGNMLAVKETRDGDNNATVTVTFNLVFLNKANGTKVGTATITQQVSQRIFNECTEGGHVRGALPGQYLSTPTVEAHVPAGYKLDTLGLYGSDGKTVNPHVLPLNFLQGTPGLGPNNTIECDYDVSAVAQSSSSSSQSPAPSSASSSSAAPVSVSSSSQSTLSSSSASQSTSSSSSSAQVITDDSHSSKQPTDNPNDVNHGSVTSSSSSMNVPSVSVVSSSKTDKPSISHVSSSSASSNSSSSSSVTNSSVSSSSSSAASQSTSTSSSASNSGKDVPVSMSSASDSGSIASSSSSQSGKDVPVATSSASNASASSSAAASESNKSAVGSSSSSNPTNSGKRSASSSTKGDESSNSATKNDNVSTSSSSSDKKDAIDFLGGSNKDNTGANKTSDKSNDDANGANNDVNNGGKNNAKKASNKANNASNKDDNGSNSTNDNNGGNDTNGSNDADSNNDDSSSSSSASSASSQSGSMPQTGEQDTHSGILAAIASVLGLTGLGVVARKQRK